MKILTDSEIVDINQNAEFVSAIGYARAIESVVLEKLNAQEPMCWTNDTELSYSQFKRPDGELTSGSFWAEYHEDCDIPLYTNPLQPADVVRDAERYRFLRDSGKGDDLIRGDCRGVYLPESAALDAAIDAAMEKMK